MRRQRQNQMKKRRRIDAERGYCCIAALINTDGLAVWYADKMGYFEELGLKTNITYFVNGTLENEGCPLGKRKLI